MQVLSAFFLLTNRLFCLIIFFCAFESQAQIINSSRGEQLQFYIYTIKPTDAPKVSRNVLIAITDTSLAVINDSLFVVLIKDWQSKHYGLFPLPDSLMKHFPLTYYSFKNLEWVKIKKISGAIAGLGLGLAASGIISLAGFVMLNAESGFLIFMTTFIPFTLVGALTGALIIKRKITNDSGVDFAKRISRKWHRNTVVERLKKIYPVPE